MRLAFLVFSLAIFGVESQYIRRRIKKIIPSYNENYIFPHQEESNFNLAQEHRGKITKHFR